MRPFRALGLTLLLLSACATPGGSGGKSAAVEKTPAALLDDAERQVAAHETDAAEKTLAEAKRKIGSASAADQPVLTKRADRLTSQIGAIREAVAAKKIADATDALAEQRSKVAAGVTAVEADGPTADTFDTARAEVDELEKRLADNKEHESDEAYAKEATTARAEVEDARKKIGARWDVVGVDLQKQQLDERVAALNEAAAKAKRGTADDLKAAETAAEAVERSLTTGASIAAKDKGYARTADRAKKTIEGTTSIVAARRAELAIEAHQAEVDQAREAAKAAVSALDSGEDAARFDAATKLVEAVKTKLETGKDHASDKGYARYAQAVTREVTSQEAAIAAAKDRAEIAAHKQEVEAAAASVAEKLSALEGQTEKKAFEEAAAAVDALEKTLAAREELTKRDRRHATYVAAVQRALPRHRAAIDGKDGQRKVLLHRAELQAATTKVDEALAALVGSLEHKRYQSAEDAVSAFKKVVEAGDEVAANDRGYQREIAAARATIEPHRLTIRTRRVEAAQAAAEEKMKGLEGTPKSAAFDEAGASLRTVESTIDAAKTLESKDRNYARFIANATAKLARDRQTIDRRRIEVEVAANATGVDAARTAADEKVKALEGEPEDAAFAVATEALDELEAKIRAGEPTAEKDAGYKRTLAGHDRTLAAYRALVKLRRHEVDVTRHRAKVTAAKTKVDETITALDGEPAAKAFGVATSAVDDYEKIVADGAAVGEGDKKYTAELAALTRQVPGLRARIEARRTAVAIAAHQKRVEAAAAAVTAKLAALDGEPKDADFETADEAIAAYEKVVTDGAELGNKDGRYKRTLAVWTRQSAGHRAQLERRRSEVAVATHRTRIDSVASAVDAQVQAMNEDPTSETIVAAEKAVKGLEQALSADDPALAKDKKHAAYIGGLKRIIPRHQAAIAKQKITKEVREHRAELDAAKKVLEEKIAALDGKTEQPLYQSAETAVSGLRKAIESGAEVGAKDRTYARVLAVEEAGIDGHRRTIKTKWVEAATAKAKAKVDALAEDPKSGDFDEAAATVRKLEGTTEAAKRLETRDRGYAKMVAAAERTAKGFTVAIERRRVEIEVAAHRKGVEAAVAKVDERIQALGDDAKSGDFGAAKSSVDDLEAEVSGGEPIAQKDAKYRGFLAGLSKRLPGYRSAIERRRVEVAIAKHRQDVTAATARVDETTGALDGEPKPGDFDTAEGAVDDLEKTLAGGADVGAKDKAYAKELAALTRSLGARRNKIARKRIDVAITKHRSLVESRLAAMDERLGALDGDDVKDSAFDDASAAVDAFEKTLADGQPVAKQDRSYAKEIGVLSRKVAPARRTVEGRRVAAAVTRHRAKIDKANEEASLQIAALAEEGTIGEAERKIAALEASLSTTDDTLKKAPKHTAYVNGLKKRLASYRAAVARTKVTRAVAEHSKELEAEKSKTDEALASLEGSLEHERYVSAEDAVSSLKRVIESGDEVAAGDQKYARVLAIEANKLPTLRLLIRQRRVEAAAKAADEKLAALDGESPDFDAAEAALRTLESTTEAAKQKETNDKNYKKFIAVNERALAAKRTAIARRRVAVEVEGHRSKVDGALAKANEAMQALEGEPGSAAFERAKSSWDDVEGVADGGEPVGAKDKRYRAYLASVKKQVSANRAAITRRRVEVDVARHDKKIEAATAGVESRIEALGDTPKSGDFSAAEDAVASLESIVKDGDEVAAKNKPYAKVLAAKSRAVAGYKNRIARRRVEVAVAAHRTRVDEALGAVDAAFEGLGDDADAGAVEKADEATTALAQAIEAGADASAKDKKHAGYLAGLSKKLRGYQAGVARKRSSLEVRAHQSKLDAARAEVDSKLEALVGSMEHRRYQAAEDSVSALKKVLESGDEVAAKDKSYAKRLRLEQAQIDAHRRLIRQRRVEAAAQIATQRIEALDGEEADFDGAEASIRDLDSTIEAAGTISAKDKTYTKFLAASAKSASRQRGLIALKRIQKKVAAHRSKVDAALVKADARMESLSGTPEDDAFDAASAAVDALSDEADAGEGVAADSKKYRLYLVSVKKKVGGYRSTIAARRGEVAIDKHRSKVVEATAAVESKLEALAAEPKDRDFTAAMDAVDQMEKVVAEADELAAKQKAYAKELAKAVAAAKGYRKQIDRRKIEVAVLAHRAKVERAATMVESAMEEATESPAAIEKAASSVGEFEAVLTSVNGLATKDRTYGKFVAQQNKKLAVYRRSLERQRVEAAVKTHASKLEAAQSTLDERLTALDGSLEHERYQAAEEAVSDLKKVIEAGDEVADRDKKYGKRLVVARSALENHRKTIRKRRVEAATAQLTARIEALQEAPKEDDFEAAMEAARVVESTTEAARQFKTNDKKYTKYLASIEAQNTKHKRTIEARRVALEVDAHRAKVDAALAAATAKIDALDGTPDDDAFGDAEASVRSMLDVVDGGEGVAAKSPKYTKYLVVTRKKAATFEKRIAARRIGVEVDKHRVKLDASLAALNEKIDALGPDAEPTAFEAADEAVADVRATIDSGTDAADKSKKYAKRLSVEKKKLPKHTARIARKRFAIELTKNQAAFEAAQSAVDEKLGALDGEANDEAFSAAQEAVEALTRTVDESAPFAKRDKKYKKRLAVARKKLPKYSKTIQRRRVALDVRAHEAKLEAAASAVEEKIGSLDEEATEGAIREAERAVESLEETINGGNEIAAKSKAYRKTLAVYRKRAPAFRATIGQRKVQGQVAEHRAELEAASNATNEAIAALDGKMKYELYRDAESAVSKLKKVAEGGMELGAEDPSYGKELDTVTSAVPNMRWQIRKSWIEAADSEVQTKMSALGADAEESAYGEASEAINTLMDTVDAGRKFEDDGKKYKKYLATSMKRARSYKGRIERLRIQGELSGVRSEIDGAAQKVAESMESLKAAPDLDKIDQAESTLAALQSRIDEAEPYAKKDKGFRKERGRHAAAIKKHKKAIARLRLEAEIGPHRAKLAEAAADAEAKIEALATDAEDGAFSSAADAVDEYAAVLDQGLGVAEKSKKYAKVLKKKRRNVARYKKQIARARAKGEIVGHRQQLEEARSALTEKMEVFEQDEIADGAFDAARDAADRLQGVVDSGRSLGKADKGYRRELKSASAAVRAARLEVAKVGVEIARSTVEDKMKALSGTDPSTYGDAQDAVEDFEKEISDARGSAKTNKKLKKYLAVQRKKVKAFDKAIKRRRANAVLDVHRAQVEAAKGSVAESLEKLDEEASPGDFKVAEDSIDELLITIGRGKPLAKKSKKYKKYLAKARRYGTKHKKTIGRRRLVPEIAAHRTRVEEAKNTVSVRLSEISDEPSVDDYTTAMEAVEELDAAIKDGRSLAKKSKKHKKFLASANRTSKKYKARIRRDKADIELAPHRKRLSTALATLSEQMTGLKSATELSAFEAAEESADDLAGVIRDGRSIAKRKKSYKKELGKAKKKLLAARRSIRKRALGLEKQRVAVAYKTFAKHVKVAKKKPSKLEYDAAMEAAERVEDALLQGKDSRNKKYKKYARSITKKVKSGRRNIEKAEKKRVVLVQTRALKRALRRLAKRVKKLKRRPSDEDMSAADEALSTLERVLEDGEPVEMKSKKYKRLAKKGRKKLRSGRRSYQRAESKRSNS